MKLPAKLAEAKAEILQPLTAAALPAMKYYAFERADAAVGVERRIGQLGLHGLAVEPADAVAVLRYSMIAWVVLVIVPDQSVTPMTSSFQG